MISTFILAAHRFNPICEACKMERGIDWGDRRWLCANCLKALWHKLELERAA